MNFEVIIEFLDDCDSGSFENDNKEITVSILNIDDIVLSNIVMFGWWTVRV